MQRVPAGYDAARVRSTRGPRSVALLLPVTLNPQGVRGEGGSGSVSKVHFQSNRDISDNPMTLNRQGVAVILRCPPVLLRVHPLDHIPLLGRHALPLSPSHSP